MANEIKLTKKVHVIKLVKNFFLKKFTELLDVPNSYIGLAGSVLAVKATEDGLEAKEITQALVGLENVTNDAQIPLASKGEPSGVAELDAEGKVPTAQLPSLVSQGADNSFTGTNKFGTVDNHVEIDNNGKIRLVGTATIFDDLSSPMIGLKLESPSRNIFLDLAEASVGFKKTCTLADYVISPPQLTHKWKIGSVIFPHLHWEQTTATMPNWLLQYRWQVQGSPKVTAWTSIKHDHNAFNYVSGTLDQITAFGPITPPVNAGLSDILQFRIRRDTTNASALFPGVDTVNATVYATSFDAQIEADTFGSNDEYIK